MLIWKFASIGVLWIAFAVNSAKAGGKGAEQAPQLEAAKKLMAGNFAGEKASAGGWANSATLCGYNCLSYATELKALKKDTIDKMGEVDAALNTGASCPAVTQVLSSSKTIYNQSQSADKTSDKNMSASAAKLQRANQFVNGMNLPSSGKVSEFGGAGDIISESNPTGGMGKKETLTYYPKTKASELNPEGYYFACRAHKTVQAGKNGKIPNSEWKRDATEKQAMRDATPSGTIVEFTNPETGATRNAQLVDYGPGTQTGRTFDLSPQLMKDLGLTTDGTVNAKIAPPGSSMGNPEKSVGAEEERIAKNAQSLAQIASSVAAAAGSMGQMMPQCLQVSTQLKKASQTLTISAQNLDRKIKELVAAGQYCQMKTASAGTADNSYNGSVASAEIANPAAKQLINIIAAGTTQTPTVSAQSASSCQLASFSTLQLGHKLQQIAQTLPEAIEKTEGMLEELKCNSDTSIFGKWARLILPRACAGEARTEALLDPNPIPQPLSACANKQSTVDQRLRCATASDPILNHYLSSIPGGGKALLSAVEEYTGIQSNIYFEEKLLSPKTVNIKITNSLLAGIKGRGVNGAIPFNRLPASEAAIRPQDMKIFYFRFSRDSEGKTGLSTNMKSIGVSRRVIDIEK